MSGKHASMNGPKSIKAAAAQRLPDPMRFINTMFASLEVTDDNPLPPDGPTPEATSSAHVRFILHLLPGDLSPRDAAATCAAAAVLAYNGMRLDRPGPPPQVVSELVNDHAAWSNLVNWGILHPAAAAPLPFHAGRMRLPLTEASASPGAEPFTVRRMCLAVAAIFLYSCLERGAILGAETAHLFKSKLLPVVTRDVVGDALEHLSAYLSCSMWQALAAMAVAAPVKLCTLLAELRPQLRRAVAYHTGCMLDPAAPRKMGLAVWGANCSIGPGQVYLEMTNNHPQPLSYSAADPRLDLVLSALDLALPAMAQGAGGDLCAKPAEFAVPELCDLMKSEEVGEEVLTAVAEGGRLLCWAQHLPKLPDQCQHNLLVLLARVAILHRTVINTAPFASR